MRFDGLGLGLGLGRGLCVQISLGRPIGLLKLEFDRHFLGVSALEGSGLFTSAPGTSSRRERLPLNPGRDGILTSPALDGLLLDALGPSMAINASPTSVDLPWRFGTESQGWIPRTVSGSSSGVRRIDVWVAGVCARTS